MNNQQIQLENSYFNQYPKTFVNRLDKEFYGNFTQVFNHIIDAKISKERNLPPLTPTEAKLLENIIAKKDNWSFSITDMAERVYVGLDAIKAARKKLVQKGYLKIIKYMNKLNGRFFGSKYIASECAEFLEENQELLSKNKISHIEIVDPETFIKSAFLPCAENPQLVYPESGENSTNNTKFNNTNKKNTTTVISENKNEVNNKTTVAVVPKEILKNKKNKEVKNESKPSNQAYSENKDSLANTIKNEGINKKTNIPPVPGTSEENLEETIQQLLELEICPSDSKKFITINGLSNVKEIIKYVLERKNKIDNLGAYTSKLLRNVVKLTKDTKNEQTPQQKLNLKLFTELFSVSENKLNDEFRNLSTNFIKYNVDIDTRVEKIISIFKNTPEEFKPKLARGLNIYGVDENLWNIFIKDGEERQEKIFRDKIEKIKTFDIESLESMKSYMISNHIDDCGLFQYINI